ncbi:MAG: hypothetical protein JXM70_10475, partial [Pirellulales bacterium]|nr:hypothetical protein [Pirellulales bacterium]
MRRHQSLVVFLFLTVMIAAVSSSNAQEPFDYFENSWNVIGLKDYEHGTRVTPDNKLILAEKRVATIRVGRNLTPLSRKQTKTLLEGWLPIVLLTTTDDVVRYDITLWATPLPNARDWKKAFDWPTEGENYLNWIQIKATNISDRKAEAKLAADVTGAAGADNEKIVWSLNPRASRAATFRIPFFPIDGPTNFDNEDAKLWLKRAVDYWQGVLADTTHITVPCRKASKAILAAH